MRPRGLIVALVALTLAATTAMLACGDGGGRGTSRESDRGSSTTAAAWEGASDDESLLYQRALSLGLDQDPDVQKLMVTTLLHQQVYGQSDGEPVAEAELVAFFEEHRDSFATPARVEVHRILLEAKEGLEGADLEAHARQLYQAVIADPSRFALLAREHSDGERAQAGGDLGFISSAGQGGLPAAVVERCFAMQPGGAPQLLATGQDWNILRVTAARARLEPGFEAARDRVLRRLRAQRHKGLYDRYLEGLRGGGSDGG